MTIPVWALYIIPGPVSLAAPVITVNPMAPSIPDTTAKGAIVAQVTVTMSDSSAFTGTLGFGPPNFDSSGTFALTSPDGTMSAAPNGPAIMAQSGSFSWGGTGPGGNLLFLNGVQISATASGTLMQTGNFGVLFVQNNAGTWFQWTGSAFQQVTGPPSTTAGQLTSAIIVSPTGPGVGPNPGNIVDHINLLATQ